MTANADWANAAEKRVRGFSDVRSTDAENWTTPYIEINLFNHKNCRKNQNDKEPEEWTDEVALHFNRVASY
jgi:hypothetical protein